MSQSMQINGIGANGSPGTDARETELSLAVSIEETNLILEGLGQLAFARVFSLIGKIQRQARVQLEAAAKPSAEA